jgi:hypothetical protein
MSWSFFVKLFHVICPSIHLFVSSSIHGWHHTEKKTLAKINNPPSAHVLLSKKGMPGPRGGTPKILISISTTNPTYILHTMLKDIQEHMYALIVQHGNALAALATLQQQPTRVPMNTCEMRYIERFWKCSL